MAWVRILLLFECFGGVPREAALYFFNTSLMDSKGNVRHFFGVLFASRGFESCCCSGVSAPASEGAGQKNFLWIPKVTGSILSGCVLLGMGSNPAAVRVFRNRPPKDLRQSDGGVGSNPAAVRVFRRRSAKGFRSWRL